VLAVRSAAVVGAGGFIGQHLTAALCAGGWRVTAYTRADELWWPDDPRAPEVVFYLASSINPARAEQYPELVTADHRRFSELLSRLARSAHPPTVVFTSSAGTVYDPGVPGRCREDAPTRATNRYGTAKLALEQLLLDHAGSVPAVILRLSTVYGPGQRVGRGQGVLASWLSAVAEHRPLPMIGDPRATRDYVYVDDVVDCMLRVDRPTEPLVLNVGSGVSTSLAQLLSIVESVVGRELPVQGLPVRSVDRQDVRLDVRRAAHWLGWRARTSLYDGVAAMWHAVRPEDQSTLTGAGAPVGTLQR